MVRGYFPLSRVPVIPQPALWEYLNLGQLLSWQMSKYPHIRLLSLEREIWQRMPLTCHIPGLISPLFYSPLTRNAASLPPKPPSFTLFQPLWQLAQNSPLPAAKASALAQESWCRLSCCFFTSCYLVHYRIFMMSCTSDYCINAFMIQECTVCCVELLSY